MSFQLPVVGCLLSNDQGVKGIYDPIRMRAILPA
jgi:hypothetical protein